MPGKGPGSNPADAAIDVLTSLFDALPWGVVVTHAPDAVGVIA